LFSQNLNETKEIKFWIIGEEDIEEKIFSNNFIKGEQILYGPEYKGMSLFEILNHTDKKLGLSDNKIN